jgi:predicted CXXCH cytochrome family protein
MTLIEDGVFALIAGDDPVHWWATGHARDTNMQFNEWLDTKHASATTDVQGSDTAQDACLACHSTEYGYTESIRALFADGTLKGTPPDAVTVETAQGGVSCMTCHDPHDLAGVEPLLVDEPYALCVSCHRDTDLISTPHHPVMEMFEGQQMVAGLDGIPSAHFAAENGPDCLTCHMPEVPVSTFTLASHALRPVLPGAAEDGPPDTCSECHEDLTTGDLQSLVDDTQSAVRERLSVAWARVASVTEPDAGTDARVLYDRAITALTFVQNDGSMGVHNYAYVDALLDSAGRDLAELSVPGSDLQPTEAPAPTATPSGEAIPIGETGERVRSGFRPITGVFIGLFVGVLLIGAAVLFRRRGREEA